MKAYIYFSLLLNCLLTSKTVYGGTFYVQPPLILWNTSDENPLHFDKKISLDIPSANLILENSICASKKDVSCTVIERISGSNLRCDADKFFSTSKDLKATKSAEIHYIADLKKGQWLIATVLPERLPESSATIDSTTDSMIGIESVVNISFPKGFIASKETVKVSVTREKETLVDYEFLCSLMDKNSGPRLPFEMRISTGKKKPLKDVLVTMKIPKEFKDSLPNNAHIVPIVQESGGSYQEIIDNFLVFNGKISPDGSSLTFTIEKTSFTNTRNKEHHYEAIFTVGTEFKEDTTPLKLPKN